MTASASKRAADVPLKSIRRFDVFAEYSRQERMAKGYPEDQAKGYGVWLAKVVAARRFGKTSDSDGSKSGRRRTSDEGAEPKFRSVGDELQTDETFDHDIIDRMGAGFYEETFVPAITEAISAGKRYEDIRDTIRKDWRPAKSRGKQRPAG